MKDKVLRVAAAHEVVGFKRYEDSLGRSNASLKTNAVKRDPPKAVNAACQPTLASGQRPARSPARPLAFVAATQVIKRSSWSVRQAAFNYLVMLGTNGQCE